MKISFLSNILHPQLHFLAVTCLCITGLLLPVIFAPSAVCVGNMSAGGRISSSLSLASGGAANIPGVSMGGGRVTVQATPGAVDATDVVDFGELSSTSGQPIVVGVSFLLRGNAAFRLNVSESSFTATSLMHRGKIVDPSADRGSFIQVRVGSVKGTGARSNMQSMNVASNMQSGISLAQLSQGPVGQGSTSLLIGGAPSTGGTVNSSDNAIEVPVYFVLPSGLEFSPAGGVGSGRFQVTLQLGAFAQ